MPLVYVARILLCVGIKQRAGGERRKPCKGRETMYNQYMNLPDSRMAKTTL